MLTQLVRLLCVELRHEQLKASPNVLGASLRMLICQLLLTTSALALALLLMRMRRSCCAAVTLAFLITKKVTLLRASAYWFCQLTGAILGSSFVYAVRTLFWVRRITV